MRDDFLKAWGIHTFIGVMGLVALISLLGYILVTTQR